MTITRPFLPFFLISLTHLRPPHNFPRQLLNTGHRHQLHRRDHGFEFPLDPTPHLDRHQRVQSQRHDGFLSADLFRWDDERLREFVYQSFRDDSEGIL